MTMDMRDLRDRVRDQRIEQVVSLLPPARILDELPLGRDQEDGVVRGRSEVAEIVEQRDDRLLVIVGPCSVHDPDAALDYAQRLSAQAAEKQDDLCIAMRVYFEKPRTTTGW